MWNTLAREVAAVLSWYFAVSTCTNAARRAPLSSNAAASELDGDMFVGIQPSLVKGIIDTVRAINERGLTVFLIEQNVHLALPISHRAYVLEQGRIVLEDAGAALLANPHVRVAYLGV